MKKYSLLNYFINTLYKVYIRYFYLQDTPINKWKLEIDKIVVFLTSTSERENSVTQYLPKYVPKHIFSLSSVFTQILTNFELLHITVQIKS